MGLPNLPTDSLELANAFIQQIEDGESHYFTELYNRELLNPVLVQAAATRNMSILQKKPSIKKELGRTGGLLEVVFGWDAMTSYLTWDALNATA